MKCSTEIFAGVCGFTTRVVAEGEEELVTLAIETECQKVQGLATVLKGQQIDAYEEIHKGFEGVVMSAVRSGIAGCCAGCVVPSGIFKSLQVAAAVALPKDISITMRKE